MRPLRREMRRGNEARHGKRRIESTDPQGSRHGGAAGLFEALLRRFKIAVHAVTLIPFYAIAAIGMGLAATPGIFLFNWIQALTQASSPVIRYPSSAIAFTAGYFLYGFGMILIVPAMNFLFQARLKPWRGAYYSLPAVRWYIHNGLTYLVRYTFLPFITPTPFNTLFYRLMGMKIGRGTHINTEFISDPSLVELGERVTIGGSVTIIAHYGVAGYLIISPVKICNGATIGIKATIMAGVEIGENAKILPHSVVLPKTKVPPGETWGGVPARKLEQNL
jgi:acetyltransferase-like isoleucine patch superfamily enzyme